MFKLFRKSESNTVIEAEPKSVLKGRSINEIIQEIHDTFYSEVERISAEASKTNSLQTDKQGLIDKCKRLELVGFSNSQEVKAAREEINRISELQKDNQNKAEVLEAVKYFSFTYPHYKFITEGSVKKICEKYNLVYSTIDRYIGTVPERNLKHIEAFKIKEEDECYVDQIFWFNFNTGWVLSSASVLSLKSYQDLSKDSTREYGSSYYKREAQKCQLEICAPIKDFDMQNMEVKDFKLSKIEIKDPVVLKPIFFKGRKHFLVVTAWGLEAEDKLVSNPVHN